MHTTSQRPDRPRLRLKTRPPADEVAFKRAIVARDVQRRERRLRPRFLRPDPAQTVEAAYFFDLTFMQKLIALCGLPVETGRLCEWRSWMTPVLILTNIAVFAGMVWQSGPLGLLGAFPQEWVDHYGFVPNRFAADPVIECGSLISSMFMHAGIFHLLGNMYFLFTTGDDVEQRMGHVLFLAFFLVGGLVADLASLQWDGHGDLPHVGASGAVSAVMGAYLALCSHKSFAVWLFRFGFVGRMISVSAWLYLGFWFALQLVGARYANDNIGYAAHIGGFVYGFAVAKVVGWLQRFDADSGRWVWRWKPATT